VVVLFRTTWLPPRRWNEATARGNLVTRDNPTQCYRYASGALTPDYTIAQNVQVSWNSGIGGGDHEYGNGYAISLPV
jgi:hypothetical protein